MTETSPIDEATVAELRAYADEGVDILGELIDIFLDDTPARLGALAAAVSGGDAEGCEQNAHALKSSCAQLGALRLSEMCRELEVVGREGDLARAPGMVASAQAEYERVHDALRAMRSPGG